MISASIPSYCSFPTSFEALGWLAAGCGGILLLAAALLFWFGRLTKYRIFLIFAPLPAIAAVWSFILVYVTSRSVLICVPFGAPAALLEQARISYRALMLYQTLVAWTEVLTIGIVLLVVGILVRAAVLRRRAKVTSD